MDHLEVQQLTDILETCPVKIPDIRFKPSAVVDNASLTRFIRSMCVGHTKQAATVEKLELEFCKATARQVDMIFSAIPTIMASSFVVRNAPGAFGAQGWTWLTYALFHPLTSHSRLRTLDLRASDVSEPNAAVLQNVFAAQKTMYRFLHDTDDDSETDQEDESCGHYTMVRVRVNAECFYSRDLLGALMCRFGTRSYLTAVVRRAVRRVAALDNAVCVIVPGRGCGWVSKTDILEVQSASSQCTSIRQLALGPSFADQSFQLQSLGHLLKTIACLDIFELEELSASSMLQLLRVCDGLQDLDVQHSGEIFTLWSSSTTINDAQLDRLRLRTLRLTCYEQSARIQAPSLAAWRSCLSQLASVVISTFGARERYEKPVCQYFNDGLSVQRFVWRSCTWKRPKKKLSYDDMRVASRQILGVTNGCLDKAERPMTKTARAAFASVIKRKGQDIADPLGRLSQDLAEAICSFATSDLERVVWVDDD